MNNPELAIFTSLVESARQYCALIDALAGHQQALKPLARILPQIHERVVSLGDPGEGALPPQHYDLDARFELFSRLHECLGECDGYWLEFDEPTGTGAAGPAPSGSLADDLTDIYFELKRGLRLLEVAEPEAVARFWEIGFKKHWGQHLIDAERHLYALSANDSLH